MLKAARTSPAVTTVAAARTSPTVTTVAAACTSPTVTTVAAARTSPTVTTEAAACTSPTVTMVAAACTSPTVTTVAAARTSPTVTTAETTTPTITTDTSFNISLPLGETPAQIEECFLESEPVPNDVLADGPIKFETIIGGSKKGNDLLVDGNGFTYHGKYVGKRTSSWVCSTHASRKCYAVVSQTGGTFTRGKRLHNHPGDPGASQ